MTNVLTENDFELLLRKVEKVYDAHITFAAHSQLYKEYLETIEHADFTYLCFRISDIMSRKDPSWCKIKAEKELNATIKQTNNRLYIIFKDLDTLITWLKLEVKNA